MKNKIYVAVLGLLVLCSCQHTHEGEHHEEHDPHAEAHNHEGHSGEIVMSPEKAKAAGVQVSVAEPGEFHRIIKTSGQLLAARGEESYAVAPVSGIVSYRPDVAEGKAVLQGTSLITLSSRNVADGDPVQKARVAYETAKQEYERMKALLPERIVSQKDYEQARQTYETARINYEAIGGEASQGGVSVQSPIKGYIKNLLVQEGEYVNVGQPLVSITRDQRLYLRADVSERYYDVLPTIRSAHFATPYDDRTYSVDQLNGKLLSYGKASGTDSYYIPVTFQIENRGNLVPGSMVEIWLLSTPMQDVLTLPREALTEEQGCYFVYLQEDAECYRKQLVTIGGDDGQRVHILSGIQAGDKVVTAGAYQVKLAGATAAIPAHTHEH